MTYVKTDKHKLPTARQVLSDRTAEPSKPLPVELEATDEAERQAWQWDHDGYPDSRGHSVPDPKCPICAESEPWELEYQTSPDPEADQ